jgi:putative nucleotidyltransferase with HDIG domain
MIKQDKGTLVLKTVPSGKVEQEVGAFLAKIFKNVSQEKMTSLVKKAPVVLSNNIPAKPAGIIASNLEKLGATVDFVPKGSVTERSIETDTGTPIPESVPHESPAPSADMPASPFDTSQVKDNWIAKIKSSVAGSFSEVNKELWLILSLLIIAAIMNYLLTAQRVVLGFYTLPTLFSAYFYGRRHATLTAFASVFMVGLLAHYNPNLFAETPAAQFVEHRWYDLTTWAGILVITAYAMGTLHENNETRINELRKTYHGLLLILRQFVSNDKYTENHSYRVSIYAAKIASYLGMSSQQVEDVRDASLLHDIGKLDISRQLLYKASHLTEKEYEGVRKHVDKTAQILQPVGGPLRRILPIILAHHDKFDGSGYHPASGENIPMEARVIAVADVYDALTSDRPYRKAMSTFDAKEIIVKGSDTEFDPKVVNAFLTAFRKGEMEVPEVVVL